MVLGKEESLRSLRGSCLVSTFNIGETTTNSWAFTEDKVAAMQLSLPEGEGDIDVAIYAFPYLGDGTLEDQKATFSSGGQVLLSVRLSQPARLAVRVPAAIRARSPWLTIAIRVPTARSPLELHRSKDGRPLGLGIEGIAVSE
jgi:hypothetical protein